MNIEKLVQLELFSMNYFHKLIVNNIYFFNYFGRSNESDLLVLTKSGYIKEFEIKNSRSDFLADFKKNRHKVYIRKEQLANNFYFVLKDGIVKINEIPDYAGLFVFNYLPENKKVVLKKIKNGPRLHNEKINEKQKKIIIDAINFRYRHYFFKEWRLNND